MGEKIQTRSYHVDWLRVLAVLFLFPFHTGQIFNYAPFYVKDDAPSLFLAGLCDFIYQWHMPLFMFLAGIGSFYALRFRSGKEYLVERFKRLIIPLIFGTLVLIPVAAYFRMFGDPQKVWHPGFGYNAIPGYDKDFFAFYPDFFNSIYPNGNFEWGHLWFLAYLFVFSLIALPLFIYIKSEKGSWIINSLKKIVDKPVGIFLFFIPIAVFEILLRGAYPNMQNLISDWANFLTFITIFIFGFILMTDQKFGEAIDKHWKASLVTGILIALSLAFAHTIQLQTELDEIAFYFTEMTLRGLGIWLCLIGFLGFGRRYLNHGGKFIQYTRQAAFPVYIIHLPIIVMIGFYTVELDLSIAEKYLVINILSLVLSISLYEVLIRRSNIFRFFMGLKKSSKSK